MLKRIGAPVALVVTLFAAAAAASAQPAPSARQLELAHRYIAAIHMDRMMDGMMKNMMPAMTSQLAKGSGLTEAQRQALSEVTAEITGEMMTRTMAQMEPIMAQTFSEKELGDLVTFYEGPTGQAVIEKTPLMMQKLMPVLIAQMPDMQTELRTKLCAKIDCAALPKPTAPKPS